MTITATFSDPFFFGSRTSSEVPYRLPVAIGGRPYQIDVARYTRAHLASLRPSNDTTAEAGEGALSNVGSWRRHQFDWTGGAGQEYFDAELPNGGAASDRTRFWKSYNMDPWTKGQLKPLRGMGFAATHSGPSTIGRIVSAGSYVYWLADAGTLYRASTSGLSAWTAAAITGTPADMTDICTDGYNVWISSSANGVYRTNTGTGAASNVSANNGDLIRYANGRLFLAINGASPALYEINASGALVTDGFSNPVAGTIAWKDIVGAPGKIYVSISVNGQGYIYRIVLNESTGSLQTALISAATMTTGEYVNSMAAYGPLMVLGTSLGLRLATINTTGGLEFGAVVTAPGEIRSVAVDERFAWFSWSSHLYGDTVSSEPVVRSGTGRADLSVFTEPLVPAYAFDANSGSTAYSGTVTGVTRMGSRTYYAISPTTYSVGLLMSEVSNTYASPSAINFGKVRFGVFGRKNAINFDMRHDRLTEASNGWIAYLGADTDTVVRFGQSTTVGTTKPAVPLSLLGEDAEEFQVQLLTGATNGYSALRRWSMVASPAPHRQEQIQVPIIMSGSVFDEAGPDEGQPFLQDVEAEYVHFREMAESGEVVSFQSGLGLDEVIVLGVELQSPKWDEERTTIEGTLMVTLVTV